MALGTEAILTALVVGALVALAVLSIGPPIYFWRLHRRDPLNLWLPRCLAIACTMLAPATIYLACIAIVRTLWGLSGVPAWTSPFTTAAVVLMALMPVYVLTEFVVRSLPPDARLARLMRSVRRR